MDHAIIRKPADDSTCNLPHDGDRIALRFIGRDWPKSSSAVQDISYAQLAQQSCRFANALRALGVQQGDVVFALAPRIPPLYAVVLGSLRAGCVFSPLFSAFGPEPIIARMTKGVGKVLFTLASYYRKKVAPVRDQLPALQHIILIDDDGSLQALLGNTPGALDFHALMAGASDAPLSELGFTGIVVGAALGGLRPIVEIMTVNFVFLALDQIINSAAVMHHMSGGQFSVPLVIRMTTGGGRQLAAQHSNAFEGWYAHIPGIKILVPGTVEDARHMLAPALADPDPVLIFEHALLLNREEECRDHIADFNPWCAQVRRAGTQLTLLSYGGMLVKAMAAAEQLAQQGIDIEVVDLRCLRPLDDATIIASVARTHRVLVVDEGWKTGSLSAELCARIVEQAFYELDAPVQRLCRAEVPMPYAKPLEEAALPQVPDIVAKVQEMLS